MRDALGSVQDGTYVEPSQDTVAQWLDEWLERRRPIDASAARRHRGKLAPSTWPQYRTYIDSMIVPVIGDIRLRDLQPEDLERLYDTLERTGGRNGTGHAPKTIVNAHGILSSALKSAVKRGKIPVSPTTRLEHPPTVERQRAAWWSAEQLRAFLHYVESDRLYDPPGCCSPRPACDAARWPGSPGTTSTSTQAESPCTGKTHVEGEDLPRIRLHDVPALVRVGRPYALTRLAGPR